MTRTKKFALTLVVIALVSGCSFGPTRPAYNFAPFVTSDPRSVVVAPVAGPGNTPDLYLATITKPLAERGYYVLPVRMTSELLAEAGFTAYRRETTPWYHMDSNFGGTRIVEPESYQEAMGREAINIAEFTGVDAVLFVQVLSWNHKVNTSEGFFANLVDSKMDHSVGFDYQLVDSQGQTIWRAERHFGFRRGGGDIFAEIWNAAAKPSDEQIDMLLARDVNRVIVEGGRSKMKVMSFFDGPSMLVGPYHPGYETDRARRRVQ